MLSWIVARVLRQGFAQLEAGDASGVLAKMAKAPHFRFPGSSSWGLDTTDRGQIEAWFHRFAALHPHFTVHEVMVKGPPWNMRINTRGSDRIETAGGFVYTNEWVQCARLRWGKLTEDILYLDTERAAALDAVLSPPE